MLLRPQPNAAPSRRWGGGVEPGEGPYFALNCAVESMRAGLLCSAGSARLLCGESARGEGPLARQRRGRVREEKVLPLSGPQAGRGQGMDVSRSDARLQGPKPEYENSLAN